MNIITKMEISKRNKERINIYIDEEYAFSISAELVYKENLKVKDKVDVQLLKSYQMKIIILNVKILHLK